MCSIKSVDVIAMQECLESYRKLLEWIPLIDDKDDDLKAERLRLVDYLIGRCDDVLLKEKEINL